MSLAKKLFRSGIWVQASKLLQFGSNAVISIILARLLAPETFGLFGYVTLYTALLAKITNVGITTGIVQQKEVTQTQLSTVFWINTGFGLLSAAFAALSAPLVADFFDAPELRILIPIFAISLVPTPFFSVHRRLLEKNLAFKRLAVCEVAAVGGSGVIGALLAWQGFGVYSLVWQYIAMSLIYLVAYILSYRWHPNLVFSFKEVKSLLTFSLKMKVSNYFYYVGQNVDFIILSKLFSPYQYGLYTVAYRILFFPVRRFGYVISDMLFPAYSKIQDEPERIRVGVVRSVNMLSMIVLPVVVIVAFFSDQIIDLMLNDKWKPLADVLYLFTAVGAIMTIEQALGFILPAIGRPGMLIWIEGMTIVFTALGVFVGSFSGLYGVGLGLVICRSLLLLFNFYMVNKYISITPGDIWKSLSGPVTGSLGMALVCYLVKGGPGVSMSILKLAEYVAAASLAYFAIIWLVNRKEIKYYYKLAFGA